MNTTTASDGHGGILPLVCRYPLRVFAPACLITLGAVAYALLRPPTWEAAQTLVLREENPAGNASKSRPEDLKTTEDTILELLNDQDLAVDVLKKVGSPQGLDLASRRGWPSAEQVNIWQNNRRLTAPKGAEFGSTEVFYLRVKDGDRQRAAVLTQVAARALEAKFQQLRESRAGSVLEELSKTAELAEADLKLALARQTAMERAAGSDLAELRILSESLSNSSDLRQKHIDLGNELRQAQLTLQTNRDLHDVLDAAQKDRKQLLATPSRLLESQPSLKRLKDGLIDAEVKLAQLKGINAEAHPSVIAAQTAVDEINLRINSELQLALRGAELDVQHSQARVDWVHGQLAEVEHRLEKLAGLRSEYAFAAAQVKNGTAMLDDARRQLAAGQARQAAVSKVSVLSELGTPQLDPYPIGPGRKVICLAGLVGGVLTGLGLLLLTAPAPTSEPRAAEAGLTIPRWTAAEQVIFQRIAQPTTADAPRGNGVQHNLTNGAD